MWEPLRLLQVTAGKNHSEAVVHSCLKIELPKTHIGGSNRGDWNLPSGYVNSLLLKMAIEIVDFPIKNGDFPVRYVKLPEGIFFYSMFVTHWFLCL